MNRMEYAMSGNSAVQASRVHVARRRVVMTRACGGFISVGAYSQALFFAMGRAWFSFCVGIGRALCHVGGMVAAVRRRWGVATRRLDSSLRSHRAWQSCCCYALSGLNKTLFASIGPNSHLRGHQAGTSSLMTKSLCNEQEDSCPGRKNPTRGHRNDGTFLWQSMPELLNATDIPPCVIMLSNGFFLNTSSSSSLSLVGGVEMISGFCSVIECAIAHHGVEGSQQSSGHGDISFGITDAADESLPDFFLGSVVLTQSDGSFSESPAQSSRAGLGDGAGLSSAGRFLEIGSEPGPEFQRVGIREAIKGTNFGGNDAAPNIADAGDALENGYFGGTLPAIGANLRENIE